MEASLHRESLKTSVNHTRSSLPPHSIRGLMDRLNYLWILWRKLWKKLGLHQLKKPFNTSFRYIGLLRIIKHLLHNCQLRWCLHVEYGLCMTNYNLNRQSLEEQTLYQQNAIIPEKKSFLEFLKTINILGGRYDREKNWEYDVHSKGFTIHT